MGVRFLETYLEKESRRACYRVDIAQLVHQYRKETDKVAVVVIDGMSCLRPLYGKLSWLNGGQFKEFYQIIQKFINNFTDLGCELVVYFDGPVQNIKLPEWKKRRFDSADVLSTIFDQLERGTEFIETNFRSTILPSSLGCVFLFLLSQHKNCKVLKSLRECDEEIAQYAFHNKCFAILAQDTDFVIYRGASYYLSVKHLDIDAMTTLCYNGFNLSVELGIQFDSLPLLASLLGNDIVDYHLLQNFHRSLRRRSRLNNMILVVAEYIRNLRYIDLSQIARFVFGSVNNVELLENSVSSYDLSKIPPEAKVDYVNQDRHWFDLVQFSKEKFSKSFYTAPVYQILHLQRFFSSTCLEDYRPENSIIPVGIVTKELRRFIYGILLHEKPGDQRECVVSEMVFTGYQSMDNFTAVEPKYLKKAKHPGLMALWTSKEEFVNECRWEILGEVFRVETALLRHVPPWFLIPSLALRYFIDRFPSMDDWELNAFVVSTVCVRHYSAEELSRLATDPLSYRQIWLYSTVSRIFTVVSDLLYCIGEPVPVEYTLPYVFTDGKLFHEKYRLSGRQATSESLCEYKVDNVEMFHLLKSFIIS